MNLVAFCAHMLDEFTAGFVLQAHGAQNKIVLRNFQTNEISHRQHNTLRYVYARALGFFAVSDHLCSISLAIKRTTRSKGKSHYPSKYILGRVFANVPILPSIHSVQAHTVPLTLPFGSWKKYQHSQVTGRNCMEHTRGWFQPCAIVLPLGSSYGHCWTSTTR